MYLLSYPMEITTKIEVNGLVEADLLFRKVKAIMCYIRNLHKF